MSSRKSHRSRKSVDYTRYGGGDDDEDFDDDFADSTPPVAKKRKVTNDNKENKVRPVDKPPQLKKESKGKGSRKSIDERLFEKELQAALQLSLSQSDGSQDNPVTQATNDSAAPDVTDLTVEDDDRAPSPILPTIENPPILPPVLTKIQDMKEDDIEVLETSVEEVTGKRRSSSKKKYIESDSEPDDSDFDAGDDDDDESPDDDSGDDYNGESDDSDFGPSKKKGKSTAKDKVSTSTPKPAAAKKPSTKTTIKQTKVTPKPSVSSIKPTVSTARKVTTPTAMKTSSVTSNNSAYRTPTAGLCGKKAPAWKAPGPSESGRSPIGGASLTSPHTGLRLGLSRNIRLKPLHSNIKLQH